MKHKNNLYSDIKIHHMKFLNGIIGCDLRQNSKHCQLIHSVVLTFNYSAVPHFSADRKFKHDLSLVLLTTHFPNIH